METIEELAVKIQNVYDIQQIEKLQRIYGYYRDYCEWEKVVDLFSDDADSVEIADYGIYKGKEGIRRFYIDLMQGGKDTKPLPGYLSIDLELQGVVTITPDGRSAKGRWQSLLMEARPVASLHQGDLRQTWGHGYYENEYVKENGKWLFKKLYFYLTFRTPYEEGWIKCPVIGQNGPDLQVPPDSPPTAYFPYPLGGQVPYHFSYPITREKLAALPSTKSNSVDLEELNRIVTQIEDVQAIEHLQRMYGYYFDNGQMDKVVDLFSEQTESIELESVGWLRGKAGVRLFYTGSREGKKQRDNDYFSKMRAQGMRLIVMQIGGVIDVDPDGKNAKGRWQTLLPEKMNIGGVMRQQWLHGYYENEYIKENGKWLFKKLEWNVTFFTSFDAGWLKIPLLGSFWTPERAKQADAPPFHFHPYPSGYHFPYHYKHPITGE